LPAQRSGGTVPTGAEPQARGDPGSRHRPDRVAAGTGAVRVAALVRDLGGTGAAASPGAGSGDSPGERLRGGQVDAGRTRQGMDGRVEAGGTGGGTKGGAR